MTTTTTTTPSGEPAERRRFQLTNLDGNNNKYYLVETWVLPDGQVFFRATYGRVGAYPQVDEKVASAVWVVPRSMPTASRADVTARPRPALPRRDLARRRAWEA